MARKLYTYGILHAMRQGRRVDLVACGSQPFRPPSEWRKEYPLERGLRKYARKRELDSQQLERSYRIMAGVCETDPSRKAEL